MLADCFRGQFDPFWAVPGMRITYKVPAARPSRNATVTLRLDDFVLAFRQNGLHEVTVLISGLRRERQLIQAGPVRLSFQDHSLHPCRDGPVIEEALYVNGCAHRVVLPGYGSGE